MNPWNETPEGVRQYIFRILKLSELDFSEEELDHVRLAIESHALSAVDKRLQRMIDKK